MDIGDDRSLNAAPFSDRWSLKPLKIQPPSPSSGCISLNAQDALRPFCAHHTRMFDDILLETISLEYHETTDGRLRLSGEQNLEKAR